jgi:hypothetical protein
MILDTYLLIKQINENNVPQQVKFEDDLMDQSPSRIAYYGNAQGANGSATTMILGLILSIILAIFVAYIFFNCIKTNCMSFLLFVIFLVLLNIPVVNIFAFIGLVIYWLVYCRKGCRPTRR